MKQATEQTSKQNKFYHMTWIWIVYLRLWSSGFFSYPLIYTPLINCPQLREGTVKNKTALWQKVKCYCIVLSGLRGIMEGHGGGRGAGREGEGMGEWWTGGTAKPDRYLINIPMRALCKAYFIFFTFLLAKCEAFFCCTFSANTFSSLLNVIWNFWGYKWSPPCIPAILQLER